MFIPLILKTEIKSFLEIKYYFSKNHKIRIFLKGLVSPWFYSKIENKKNERRSIVCSLLENDSEGFPMTKFYFPKIRKVWIFLKGLA